MTQFKSSYKIYYEDTDLSGVVYHANYVKFLERGRTDFLSSRRVDLRSLIEQENIQFVIVDLHVKYYKAAHLNDQIMVLTELADLKGAKLVFKQSIVKHETEVLCDAKIVVACLDLKFKPTRVPDRLKKELKF